MKIDHETVHELLTETDIDECRHRPNRQILSQLEQFEARSGKKRADIKVLDFGCGRGALCVFLRRRGFDTFGVDIDVEGVEFARDFLRSTGDDPDKIGTIDESGLTKFPDGFFDFVISDQVIEHVEDIELAAMELARLTRTGGGGIHSYPANLIPVEPHISVPFVHWLPKNSLRTYLIYLCLFFKKETPWQHLRHLSRMGLARHYTKYLRERTFYRSSSTTRAVFEDHGFSCEQIVAEHPKIKGHALLGKTLAIPGVTWILNLFLSKFVESDLALVKLGCQT